MADGGAFRRPSLRDLAEEDDEMMAEQVRERRRLWPHLALSL